MVQRLRWVRLQAGGQVTSVSNPSCNVWLRAATRGARVPSHRREHAQTQRTNAARCASKAQQALRHKRRLLARLPVQQRPRLAQDSPADPRGGALIGRDRGRLTHGRNLKKEVAMADEVEEIARWRRGLDGGRCGSRYPPVTTDARRRLGNPGRIRRRAESSSASQRLPRVETDTIARRVRLEWGFRGVAK